MTAAELLTSMGSLRVLIVGDICLDHWCYYSPFLSDPSRETSIPRIAVTASERTPGAAGTVANNLQSLGVKEVAVLGVIGDDGHGYELLKSLRDRNIGTELLVRHATVPTFTYTKLINSETQVEDKPRVDFVFTNDMPPDVEIEICERLRNASDNLDVICVSDQAETERGGVITAAVRELLSEIARAGKLVWVDSRRRMELFRHVVVKVNHDEAFEARRRCGDISLAQLRELVEAPVFFVTHGGSGVQILNQFGETWLLTQRVASPVDICGAGDSFSAAAACALASGATHHSTARLGHLVASVTIMKRGTGFALPEELLEAERDQER